MTVAADTVALNIIFDGLLFMVLSIMMKKYLPLKKHTQSKTRVQKTNAIGQIDTLFMTKTAENHTLWGRT